jgi:hypothetical protein
MNEMMKKEENNTVAAVHETMQICKMLMETSHYKKMGQEGIFAIVQKAKSIGVDPLDALNGGFYFVQGKVELTATMMNDLIRRKGHSITKDKKSDEKVCILHGKRKDNGDTWSESFSIEDAKLAGIYRNQWLKYPKDMLFARALSRLARQLFPDVIKGCYVDGEITQAIETDKIQEKEVPDISLSEMEDILRENLEIPNDENLIEYLGFCKERVQKPMREILKSWLENPDPFINHYKKWSIKKFIEEKEGGDYEEDNSSLEEHA